MTSVRRRHRRAGRQRQVECQQGRRPRARLRLPGHRGRLPRARLVVPRARRRHRRDATRSSRCSTDFDYSIGTDPDDYFVRVAATDVTEAIREPRVTAVVSAIARVPEVRAHLVELFREVIASRDRPGIVVEGRDITTVVAPDAQVRILLTATEEARMARRSAELVGESAEDRGQQLTSRDAQDSQVVDFMNAADGVTTIDSTDLDFDADRPGGRRSRAGATAG